MFQEILSIVSTYSILIAAVLGVIRFRVIQESYYPLIYICWAALVAEIVASIVQKSSGTLWPSNVYVLIEGLLFTWQFRKWGSFQHRPWLFYLIQAAITILWIIDSFFIHTIDELSSIYRISFSVLLVILAIDHINKLIVHERRSFITNAKFLLCIGVIFFFSYKFTLETFYLYALQGSQNFEFVISIFAIQKYVNLFANLLYAYVVLWIPRKKIFLQPLR
ncbi:MAG: hypothetical protein EOO04_15680 [Chitinophagaceae bacterium]|nr:MAG: hypothetical protein EOO04_15680 [Chitinophagaceae bacterium]